MTRKNRTRPPYIAACNQLCPNTYTASAQHKLTTGRCKRCSSPTSNNKATALTAACLPCHCKVDTAKMARIAIIPDGITAPRKENNA